MSIETGWITPDHWENPSYQGTLRKKGARGHVSKKWTERYFRLKNDSLFWFKNSSSDTLRGHIPLANCRIDADTMKTNKYENCFKLYCKKLDKSFYLAARDYSEMLQWISAIKIASTSSGSTLHAVPGNAAALGQQKGDHQLLLNGEEMDGDFENETMSSFTGPNRSIHDAQTTIQSGRSTLIADVDDKTNNLASSSSSSSEQPYSDEDDAPSL